MHVLLSLLIPISWASSTPTECQAFPVKLTTKHPSLKDDNIDVGSAKTLDMYVPSY